MSKTPRLIRILTATTVATLLFGSLAACGDDNDDASPEEAFCDAGDSLRANIEGFADIDIVAEGTDAVEAQFAAIEEDVKNLESAGTDVAVDEIGALETAVEDLGEQLEELESDFSPDVAAAAVTSLRNIVDSAGAALDTLSSTCS